MSLAYHADPTVSAVVLSKAVLRAAKRLGVKQAELADMIGVSAPVISRAVNGGTLPQFGKVAELSILFVRLFRSLDAIVGGDEAVAAEWLRAPHAMLGAKPVDAMKTITGLTATLAYLDSRRALV